MESLRFDLCMRRTMHNISKTVRKNTIVTARTTAPTMIEITRGVKNEKMSNSLPAVPRSLVAIVFVSVLLVDDVSSASGVCVMEDVVTLAGADRDAATLIVVLLTALSCTIKVVGVIPAEVATGIALVVLGVESVVNVLVVPVDVSRLVLTVFVVLIILRVLDVVVVVTTAAVLVDGTMILEELQVIPG